MNYLGAKIVKKELWNEKEGEFGGGFREELKTHRKTVENKEAFWSVAKSTDGSDGSSVCTPVLNQLANTTCLVAASPSP